MQYGTRVSSTGPLKPPRPSGRNLSPRISRSTFTGTDTIRLFARSSSKVSTKPGPANLTHGSSALPPTRAVTIRPSFNPSGVPAKRMMGLYAPGIGLIRSTTSLAIGPGQKNWTNLLTTNPTDRCSSWTRTSTLERSRRNGLWRSCSPWLG